MAKTVSRTQWSRNLIYISMRLDVAAISSPFIISQNSTATRSIVCAEPSRAAFTPHVANVLRGALRAPYATGCIVRDLFGLYSARISSAIRIRTG